jgi:hypothetical protein
MNKATANVSLINRGQTIMFGQTHFTLLPRVEEWTCGGCGYYTCEKSVCHTQRKKS